MHIEIPTWASTKIRKYINKNKIKDASNKVITIKEAIYSMVMCFVDEQCSDEQISGTVDRIMDDSKKHQEFSGTVIPTEQPKSFIQDSIFEEPAEVNLI